MDKATKSKEVSVTKTAARRADTEPAPEAPGKRPVWSRTINRVDCSIWKHDQDAGPRYTIALSRSYLDRRSNQWKRNSYFDRSDLQDVRLLCDAAEERILALAGMAVAAAED